MLRQLARLTAPVLPVGDRACAIAVYADAADQAFPAADLGFEGVACIDDAARAVVLLLDVWQATRLPRLRAWAESLADFVRYMQLDDGRFVNFITSWRGERNDHGPTSFPGGGFWHARGVRALAKLWIVCDDEHAREGLVRGLPLIREAHDVPPDQRSIHAIMAIELLRAGRMLELRADLARWCDEIASCRNGDVLLDNSVETEPHLWAHVQEGVLADASVLLDRPALLDVAKASARAYLEPIITSRFDLPTVQPYGVASAAYGVERLAAVSRERRYADLARMARAWFGGRNPANAAVYDRGTGRVHDGIDDGVLNPHSGAESNIVGGQALIVEITRMAPQLMPVVDACFASHVRDRLSFLPRRRSA